MSKEYRTVKFASPLRGREGSNLSFISSSPWLLAGGGRVGVSIAPSSVSLPIYSRFY